MSDKKAAKKSTARRRPARTAGKPRAKKAAAKKAAKPLYSDLESRLEEQRDEIMILFLQDLGVGQGGSSNHEGEDDVDRANFDFSREMALSMSTGEREVLMLIGEALDRLKVGVYGCCSHCSRSIAEARLVAIPWARHCVKCQELEEKGLLDA